MAAGVVLQERVPEEPGERRGRWEEGTGRREGRERAKVLLTLCSLGPTA